MGNQYWEYIYGAYGISSVLIAGFWFWLLRQRLHLRKLEATLQPGSGKKRNNAR